MSLKLLRQWYLNRENHLRSRLYFLYSFVNFVVAIEYHDHDTDKNYAYI